MATTFEPLLIGENRWLNAIAVTEANNAAIPITRTRAVKNYSCSFCKNEGHTIQKCTSIRLSLELDKVELNVENFVPVIVEEINRTMGIGTYNHDKKL